MHTAALIPVCAAFAVASLAAPASASAADDHVVTVVKTTDDDDDDEAVTKTVVVEHDDDHHHHHHSPWFGLGLGSVFSPLSPDGRVRPGKRVTSNPFQGCIDPGREKLCGSMRGLDIKLQYYQAHDAWSYPRWMAYFRTGYSAGRIAFDPQSAEGHAPGEATSLRYVAVPMFFGGNIYAFKRFPIRPYAGMGFGFDVVKLRYKRHEQRGRKDASARIGFELHAGLEARISNVVALTAEIQQLWSARRKLSGVPDFSNEGFNIVAGLAISIPLRRQHRHRHRTVKKIVIEKKAPPKRSPVVPPPAVAPVAPPAPAAPPAPNIEINQTVTQTPAVPAIPTPPVAPAAPAAPAAAPVPVPAPAPAPAAPPPAPPPAAPTPAPPAAAPAPAPAAR